MKLKRIIFGRVHIITLMIFGFSLFMSGCTESSQTDDKGTSQSFQKTVTLNYSQGSVVGIYSLWNVGSKPKSTTFKLNGETKFSAKGATTVDSTSQLLSLMPGNLGTPCFTGSVKDNKLAIDMPSGCKEPMIMAVATESNQSMLYSLVQKMDDLNTVSPNLESSYVVLKTLEALTKTEDQKKFLSDPAQIQKISQDVNIELTQNIFNGSVGDSKNLDELLIKNEQTQKNNLSLKIQKLLNNNNISKVLNPLHSNSNQAVDTKLTIAEEERTINPGTDTNTQASASCRDINVLPGCLIPVTNPPGKECSNQSGKYFSNLYTVICQSDTLDPNSKGCNCLFYTRYYQGTTLNADGTLTTQTSRGITVTTSFPKNCAPDMQITPTDCGKIDPIKQYECIPVDALKNQNFYPEAGDTYTQEKYLSTYGLTSASVNSIIKVNYSMCAAIGTAKLDFCKIDSGFTEGSCYNVGGSCVPYPCSKRTNQVQCLYGSEHLKRCNGARCVDNENTQPCKWVAK